MGERTEDTKFLVGLLQNNPSAKENDIEEENWVISNPYQRHNSSFMAAMTHECALYETRVHIKN